ncbi:hypothetical protein C5Y96_25180 [Blastopirellula marina]|uniref:Uncharacterized protein n=1 Tax=Blastopirellula marina TaxID=124 RepID=A0A2S8EZ70_9BACT|nr:MULTISPECIES: hypothetical protein [Pirellulaceae]PQO25202.1 hypothetical protein C5Y96_25180 [Blastopirellula marina]RCS41635.1 hypothetical protein DTL36_25230 [Bremerella cremea]
MSEAEPNPYAPPQPAAKPVSSLSALRILAWCSLLLPYAMLPLLMMLPQFVGGILGFILFIPMVPMTIAVTIGRACALGFKLIPPRYIEWLSVFYVVTIIVEYMTLFEVIYPNFSWK